MPNIDYSGLIPFDVPTLGRAAPRPRRTTSRTVPNPIPVPTLETILGVGAVPPPTWTSELPRGIEIDILQPVESGRFTFRFSHMPNSLRGAGRIWATPSSFELRSEDRPEASSTISRCCIFTPGRVRTMDDLTLSIALSWKETFISAIEAVNRHFGYANNAISNPSPVASPVTLSLQDIPRTKRSKQKQKATAAAYCCMCSAHRDRMFRFKIGDSFYFICTKCYRERYRTCWSCGRTHDKTSVKHVAGCPDHVKLCRDCYNKYFKKCSLCGKINLSKDMADSIGSTIRICKECAKTCKLCARCGNLAPGLEYQHGGKSYCVSCWDILLHPNNLKPHDHKPIPTFHLRLNERPSSALDRITLDKAPNHMLFMGVELEIDEGWNGTELIDKINTDWKGRLYCKHDGSLSRAGIEIVSHPATLAFHQNEFNWDILCSGCRKYEYISEDSDKCGLHIHVNRNYLSSALPDLDDPDSYEGRKTVSTIKLCSFMATNREKVFKVARRSSTRYSEMPNSPHDGMSMIQLTSTETRYLAVNISNRDTVEFRMFKGTVHPETILASLEFVDAVCRFVKHASPMDCLLKTGWDKMCDTIVQNKKIYPNIYKMLDGKDLFPKTPLKQEVKPFKKQPNRIPLTETDLF